jgi:hypothetical protein
MMASKAGCKAYPVQARGGGFQANPESRYLPKVSTSGVMSAAKLPCQSARKNL